MSAHSFTRYLTRTEERQLFAELRRYNTWTARRDLALFRLLRATGIRVASLCGLTTADARRALRDHRLTLQDAIAKGGRGYDLHASRKARAALLQLLALRRQRGLPEDPDAPLLCHARGQGAGLTPRNVQLRMRHWGRAAGLAVPASPHWWRHTLAKRLLETSTSSNPLAIVGTALGHRDINSTLIYTRPDREEVDAAMENAQ